MPKNAKKPESKTKTIIKEMFSSVDCSLVEAVEKRNLMFPESATSTQNLSNKLQRESITFKEALELAEALGLKVRFVDMEDEMAVKTRGIKEDAKQSILEAANILTRKADEIVSDFDTEKVTELYITLRITGNETPILDVQKSYAAI